MEALTGFCYSLTMSEMFKIQMYMHKLDCLEERNHLCFYEMIKKAIIPICENERLCYEIKRDLIEDVFKTLENNHKRHKGLIIVLLILKMMCN